MSIILNNNINNPSMNPEEEWKEIKKLFIKRP